MEEINYLSDESSDNEDGPTIYKKKDLNEIPKRKYTSIKQVANEIVSYINKIRVGHELKTVAISSIERVEEVILLSGTTYKFTINLREKDNPSTIKFVAKKKGEKKGKPKVTLATMPDPISIFPSKFLEKMKQKHDMHF